MLIGPSKNIANNGKGMYVGLKQPLGDGERCVTPARAAAKETNQFILITMKFVSHILHRGSVHASKTGKAQNIQGHICLKSERVL